MISRVGVLYHPRRPDARASAEQAAGILAGLGVEATMLPAWDDEAIRSAMPDWQMCLTCGGDGTILRTSRIAAPFGVPQLGINLGRLGFLSELQPDELASRLPDYIDGGHTIEERAMIRGALRLMPSADGEPPQPAAHYDALNEILVARGVLPRVVRVAIEIDGAPFTSFGATGCWWQPPPGRPPTPWPRVARCLRHRSAICC
jgi:NAD+ kinase